jgi:murein hydrolase activator
VDIKAGQSAAVHAVAAGRVVYADQFLGYGNLVIVDHGSGFYTLYSNLTEMSLQVGAAVAAGTQVGVVADYLHFEIRKDGKSVDPLDWLKP